METFSVLLAICAGIVWVLREAHRHWEGLSHSHGDVIKWKLFTALLDICAGNSPVPGDFPAQRPMTRNFGCFFDLRPNKLFSKQSWGWWFETPWRPLSGHRNVRANIENSSLEDQGGCQVIDLNRGNCITFSTILFFYWLPASAGNHIRRDVCGGPQYTLLHSHRLLAVGWPLSGAASAYWNIACNCSPSHFHNNLVEYRLGLLGIEMYHGFKRLLNPTDSSFAHL